MEKLPAGANFKRCKMLWEIGIEIAGDFTATVINNRVTYTMTPLMFVSALVQYNSSTASLSSNVRLRWEYRPGSELFVVYTDGRNLEPLPNTTNLMNRSFAVKITRLVRF